MKKIVQELVSLKNYYNGMANKAYSELKRAPKEDRIRAVNRKGNSQYYLITKKGDTKGKYITRKELNIAKEIIQRDYAKKVYTKVLKMSNVLDKCIFELTKEPINKLHMENIARQQLINPYELSDDEYIRMWQEAEYAGKGFDDDLPEIYTEKGERVRSKSEKIIADKLLMLGIPYHYEYPITLSDNITLYPDFTLLNIEDRKEILLEHFGMMDDPIYCQKAIDKMNLYSTNNIVDGDRILYSYETSKKPLNTNTLTKQLKYLF